MDPLIGFKICCTKQCGEPSKCEVMDETGKWVKDPKCCGFAEKARCGDNWEFTAGEKCNTDQFKTCCAPPANLTPE